MPGVITRLLRITIAATAGALGTALGTSLLMGPAVAAPDHVLNAAGIEQTVLRAQPPTTLGPWRQRSYNRWAIGDARINPSVCSSLNGSRYRLPNAMNGGVVGYSFGPSVEGSASLHQYANQAAADSALAALRAVDCPDATKVTTDTGEIVPGEQGTDFIDASRTGVASAVTYQVVGGDGRATIMDIRTTTQVGLAVLQTRVSLVTPAATPRAFERAVALNRKWHAQLVAAYEAFGVGASR